MLGIDQDLKTGQLKRAYLLYGPENFLKKAYRDRIKRALLGDDDSMNYVLIKEGNLDVNELIGQAQTMPFFADRRVICVENSGAFAKTEDALADFFEVLPETACLVFCEKEVKKNTRTFKAVSKHGDAVELVTPTDSRQIYKWLLPRMKVGEKTLQIKKAAWEAFLLRAGSDMYHMINEMEKLVAYCADREFIDLSDVEMICSGFAEDKVFEMIRAFADRNSHRAMQLYRDLLLLKEPAMKVLILLEGQLKNIYKVKQMSAHHVSDDEIARRVRLPGFAVRQNRALGANFTEAQLEDFMRHAATAEWNIKSGRLSDRMALEMLMTELVRA